MKKTLFVFAMVLSLSIGVYALDGNAKKETTKTTKTTLNDTIKSLIKQLGHTDFKRLALRLSTADCLFTQAKSSVHGRHFIT